MNDFRDIDIASEKCEENLFTHYEKHFLIDEADFEVAMHVQIQPCGINIFSTMTMDMFVCSVMYEIEKDST